MASKCSKSVSSLNGICSALESGGVPLSVCEHLQEKSFRLDKAMSTAKQSASGFSVCFFWSVTEGIAKHQRHKNKRRRKKTEVVQGPQLPDLPALNLASSEGDLVFVKTPIKAHQENPENQVSSDQPSQADENDNLVSLGSEAIDLENCEIVVFEVKEDIPGVAYARRRCDGAGADSEG